MFQSQAITLWILLATARQVFPDATYENSDTLCETKCSCTHSNDGLSFVVDCSHKDFHNMLANWPPHNKTLVVSLAFNNYTSLDTLPPTEFPIEVILSNCGIKYINSAVFDSTKNVKLIDLSHNLLTAEEISADKFRGPSSSDAFEPLAVEHLNLAYNQIHSLNKNIFEHMPELKTLNLEGNDFVVLDLPTQMALTSVKGLVSLNLANNELTELVDEAITGLTNLTELNLSRNDLDFVPESLALLGESLEILTLDDNPILEIDGETFLGLTNILQLSLNNLTTLKFINGNAFAPMKKLKKLSMCHNFLLSDIDREAFGVNQTLEEFYLRNNRLYKLDYKLIQWSKLRVFDFRRNPLDCTCDLYNITSQLSKDITRNEDSPYCMDPRTGMSTRVFYLKSDICGAKRFGVIGTSYVTHHFTVLRIAMVALSVTLLLAAAVALTLGWSRYRKLQRNRNYPFASQVLYNPLTTTGRF